MFKKVLTSSYSWRPSSLWQNLKFWIANLRVMADWITDWSWRTTSLNWTRQSLKMKSNLQVIQYIKPKCLRRDLLCNLIMLKRLHKLQGLNRLTPWQSNSSTVVSGTLKCNLRGHSYLAAKTKPQTRQMGKHKTWNVWMRIVGKSRQTQLENK